MLPFLKLNSADTPGSSELNMDCKPLQSLFFSFWTSMLRWLHERTSDVNRLLCLFAVATIAATPACGAPLREAEPGSDRQTLDNSKDRMTTQRQHPSERFRTLDEYLEFLERTQAPVDGAWYQKIRPDVYVLKTGNLRVLGAEPGAKEYTRAELMQKFGFSR
jgi:hypothetical protein